MSFQKHLNLDIRRAIFVTAFAKTTEVIYKEDGLIFSGPYVNRMNEMFGLAGMLELWMTGKAAINPKVFRCDLDYESIDQIDIRLPIEDYAQPFDTCIIEFPESYSKARVCRSGHPDFCILHRHESKRIVSLTVFDSAIAISEHLGLSGLPTLEDQLQSAVSRPLQPGSLEMYGDESNITVKAVRAALNLMLLVMDHKTTKMRDDKYAERLEKSIRKNKNPDWARGELERLPEFYSLDHKVKLFEDKIVSSERGEPTGRKVAPHWRRGHWRMQPYGEKSSLRKRILIKAIRIHPELFGEKNTTTTYVSSERSKSCIL